MSMQIKANGKEWRVISARQYGAKLAAIPGRDRLPLSKSIAKLDNNNPTVEYFGGFVRIGTAGYRDYSFMPVRL